MLLKQGVGFCYLMQDFCRARIKEFPVGVYLLREKGNERKKVIVLLRNSGNSNCFWDNSFFGWLEFGLSIVRMWSGERGKEEGGRGEISIVNQ